MFGSSPFVIERTSVGGSCGNRSGNLPLVLLPNHQRAGCSLRSRREGRVKNRHVKRAEKGIIGVASRRRGERGISLLRAAYDKKFGGGALHEPGDVVDSGKCKYEVVSFLGNGGSGGDCFVAEREGEQFAMKVMSFSGMKNWKQLELFEREARTLQNLSHPRIPKYIDYFEIDTETDKTFYLIQEIGKLFTLFEKSMSFPPLPLPLPLSLLSTFT